MVVLLLWVWASPLEAAVYYVAVTGGSDANSCMTSQTVGTPKQHLTGVNGGLACLSAGDTLSVRAGTYVENLTDPTLADGTSWINATRIAAYADETVWLEPSSGDNVLHFVGTQHYIIFDHVNMRGASSGAVVFLGSINAGSAVHHIRIQNAEIVNDNGAGFSGQILGNMDDSEFLNLTVHGHGGPYAFYINGDRNLIDGCHIYDTEASGIQIRQTGPRPADNIIRNCTIHAITTSSFFSGPDIRIRGITIDADRTQIYNNVLYDIGFAVGVVYGHNSGAIYLFGGDSNHIWHNTVAFNRIHGIRIDADPTNTDVRNTISYGQTGGPDEFGFLSQAIRDTNNAGSTVLQTNLFDINPIFVSTTTPDYRLQAGSPAIDTGTTLGAVVSDPDGVVRPQGSVSDIGAYEFSVGAGPPPPTTEPQKYRIRFRTP